MNTESFTGATVVLGALAMTMTMAMVFLLCLVLAVPTMFLWNWLCPIIFGLIKINLWQALGLNILANIFFKSYSK
jgi:hypothetical protein